jgi:hypothetical protein
MNAKNNRVNHDFQIVHFLAGSCHTPDGAYSLMCDLREDRLVAVKSVEAQEMRTAAKLIRARRAEASEDEAVALEGAADRIEVEANAETLAKCVAAAHQELITVEKAIAALQPMRKYSHMSDPEAHEAAQHDEWLLELIDRGENSILTTGALNPDLLQTMRMHPAFEESILPRMGYTLNAIRDPSLGAEHILKLNKKQPLLQLT